MSTLINSLLIEPVVRHARRFSSPEPEPKPDDESAIAFPGTTTTTTTGPEVSVVPLGKLSRSDSQSSDTGDWSAFEDHDLASTTVQLDHVAGRPGFRGSLPHDEPSDDHSRSVLAIDLAVSPPPTHNEVTNSPIAHTNVEDSAIIWDQSTRSVPTGQAPSQSLNPSYTSVPSRARTDTVTSSATTGMSSLDVASQQHAATEDTRSDNVVPSSSMSGLLPADDGMKALRDKMHGIYGMALSTEDKARKMHALMVSDYTAFRQRQVKDAAHQSGWQQSHNRSKQRAQAPRSRSPSSASSLEDDEAAFDVRPEDVETTFWPHEVPAENLNIDDDDPNALDNEPIFGCRHYMRNIKVQCSDCRRWYTCRHCHDEVEDHSLIRKNIRHMLCMYCGHPQKADDHCEECEEEAATYYCDICKLWDNDASKKIYHCPDCGICRKGEGIGKDYVHCKKCNVCVSINHVSDHRCVERATECDCPICGDYMFSSSAAVVAMRCGHYIHRECYDAYMQTSYKCPICSRSAVNMELQWRKMDLCLESQPMPDSYRDTQVWIICNDCAMRSCVPFHWLGNKCRFCDSYNTNQVKIVNGAEPLEPQDQERRAAQAVQAAQANGIIPDGLAPDLLPSTVPTGRPRQRTEPAPANAEELLAQVGAPSASRGYIAASPAPETIVASLLQQRPDERSPPRRSSDPIHSRHSEMSFAPSQPLPISAHSRSNIDIARMTSAAATAAASAQPAPSDDDDSESAPSETESEDSTTFWGSSISPPNISLMPSGWTSPRLFASSPASAPADVDAARGDDPSVLSSWGINPGTWRLNSPNFFGSASSPSAEAADLGVDVEDEDADRATNGVFPTSWHPSQWHLGNPHEYFFGSSTNARPSSADAIAPGREGVASAATLPSFPSGWHPSHWRLSSPHFFSGDNEAIENGVDESDHPRGKVDENAVRGEDNDIVAENEGGLWNLNIRPRFLTERFGSFSSGGGVPLPWARNDEVKNDDRTGKREQSESSEDDEAADESGSDNEEERSEQEEGEEDDDEEEDELDLIGHR